MQFFSILEIPEGYVSDSSDLSDKVRQNLHKFSVGNLDDLAANKDHYFLLLLFYFQT